MSNTFNKDLYKYKVVFIAGGTSGINLGIAKSFGRLGATVIVIGRNPEKAAKAEQAIKDETGAEAMGMSSDVRDIEAITNVYETIKEKYGLIDVVVSGAAGNFMAPVVGLSSNGFKTVVDIDLFGTYHVFKAGFDYIKKPGASLIAITAGQAVQASPYQIHAAAAKAGVNQVVKALALEWGPAGVRTNAICPGGIEGTEGVKFLAADPSEFETAVKRIPQRRLGKVEEIGDMAVFLSSDAAAYVNGQIINVDGGYLVGDGSFDCLTPLKRD